ncbi:relaxase/mobilization nuclease [Streptomyces sp. GQFP]|uniref:relaxase/mobilization nuclease n=1 Tax=Streptomyces sp. GQFP TaxID=2907545 RepID=UPI001F285E48|nr:relaxase/mobilization nuclease [Streptomyces sp. GQFP]UIX34376.1 relaxase/mobilization nuclease [Streptomyces sp. GQFP]
MIPRVNERTISAHDPLSEALGRAVIAEEGLTEHTIVAYWPALDSYTLDDEQATWSAVQWADHLEDPLFENPFAASPRGDRQAISHLDVRLHPDDRDLSGAEWAEIAHRFARAAGIEVPGDVNSCRWIAVQAKPRRLDVIANLIRLDGTWQHPPVDLGRRLNDEARRIEQDLHLIPVATSDGPGSTRSLPTASAQLAGLLTQLADEQSGPLATVRGLIEHSAHRLAHQAGAAGSDTARRLELIATRLHHVQEDLDATAGRLTGPPRLRTALDPAPPAARASARHAP